MKSITLWGCILVALAASAIVCSPLRAQQISASITGSVVDPGGAVINGATVTATDIERGTVYTAKTADGGLFTFARLPIGTYDIKAEASGFRTLIQSHLTLVLNQT
ncbi:MAG: carboxypeptidase-like regulatory domain-containing protein, partial [Acidobacteriaceae bacterium]